MRNKVLASWSPGLNPGLNKGEKTKLDCECVTCAKKFQFEVDTDKYYKWVNRELAVQLAFPHIPREERELLISGICPTCWKKMFGSE